MHRLIALSLASMSFPVWAGSPKGGSFSVPALDDAGLVLLAVLVGGVATWAVKRRSRK